MHKVLAVFIGQKLLFGIFFSKPLIYWNTAGLILHWHHYYLTEKASCSLEHNKNSQGAKYCYNMVCDSSKTLCRSWYSQVKISSCTLSYTNCNLTRLGLQHKFVTNLTIFAKLKYYFDIDKLAITLQSTINKELCHFPILIWKYRVLQLLRCEKSQSSWRSFYVFFLYKNLICYFSWIYRMETSACATYNISQAGLLLVDFVL